MPVDNLVYRDIGIALENANPNTNHQYLYAQEFVSEGTGSPFESLIPKITNFYGPKVLTLQIISRAYTWSDTYIAVEVNRFKSMFTNWSKFTVFFWIDRILANAIDAVNEDTVYNDQMDVVRDKLIDLCAELGDYGWEYKGELTSGVDQTFFQPYIDAFWAE